MKAQHLFTILGALMMAGAGTRLSMQLGLTGFSAALLAIFAVGIILIAREPTRQLSERVRVLEAQGGKATRSPS